MGRFVDITGQRYDRLVAVRQTTERTQSGGVKWLFRCDCGSEKVIAANSVRSGMVKSCGCMAKPHGMTGTRLYNIWVDMRQRCQNENYTDFHLYGGRGIRVCEEWQQFLPFYDWAMASGYQDNLSVDRKDVNGNYEPQNCRWATAKEQANNTRKNRLVTINGKAKSIDEWCKQYGISKASVYRRVRTFGMTYEEALTVPKMRRCAE